MNFQKDNILKDIKLTEPNLLYFTLSGSRIYGTDNESSDYDYRGIFANTLDELLGLFNRDSQTINTEDIILYSLGKFVKLASNANPNVLELLFISETGLYIHPLFKEFFINNKYYFLSQKCYYTYSGYAFSQMKKNKHKSLHGSIRTKYLAGTKEDPYDAKFAGHCCRLLLNGKEILESGIFHPKFKGNDLEFLKRVRNGEEFKTATDLYLWVEDMDQELQKMKEKTELRHHVDINYINNLLVSFYHEYYKF